MKRYLAAVVIVLILVLGACTERQEESNASKVDELHAEVNQLNEQLTSQQDRLQQLEQILTNNEATHQIDERTTQLELQLEMVKGLVYHLPQVQVKQGYVKDVKQERAITQLEIDFAEMKLDVDEPNGFKIVNDSEVTTVVSAVDESSFYVLKGTEFLMIDSETLSEQINDYPRLFNFYLIEEKLVLAAEQYLP